MWLEDIYNSWRTHKFATDDETEVLLVSMIDVLVPTSLRDTVVLTGRRIRVTSSYSTALSIVLYLKHTGDDRSSTWRCVLSLSDETLTTRIIKEYMTQFVKLYGRNGVN